MIYRVGPTDQIPQGESLLVSAEDSGAREDIAIFHTEEGEFYAVQDECTHEVASLSDGWLEGCQVECPIHASSFDLRTGRVQCMPATEDI